MDRSERLGLGVSTAGHILLFGALSLGLLHTTRELPSPPPSIDVTLADEIALESRTPNPSIEAPQVATAPEVGPMEPEAAPPDPAPAPPAPAVAQPPPPKPRAQDPVPPPQRPAPPRPAPPQRATPREDTPPAPARAAPRPEPRREAAPPRRAARLGADFLKGIDSDAPSQRSDAQAGASNAPLGAAAARALNAEISRQLKRFWRAPTGADADQLVTVLRWRLNRDGTIAAGPELVEQTGQTASNRPQQQLHIEAAMRAVRAAAPFQLPAEYYDNWKYIREFSFDRRL